MNMQELIIDDLTAPHFSEEGLKLLAAREEIGIDFSLDGIIRFAQGDLDVPLYRDSFYLDRLEAFLLEGDRNGGSTRAGKGWMSATFADIIIQRSRFAFCQGGRVGQQGQPQLNHSWPQSRLSFGL